MSDFKKGGVCEKGCVTLEIVGGSAKDNILL